MAFDFPNIRTERLILRVPRVSDAAAVHAYRGDPEVARYQDWPLPYSREQAESRVQACIDQGGPVADGGWNVTIADADDHAVIGDLYLGLQWGTRAAEIGYTLAPEFHGRGFASEAVDAGLRWFFETAGVNRVGASLHPDNVASARVLERTGFVFEGETRDSFWVGDENSSDWIYGLLRADWDAWRARPATPPERVELVEITEANQREVRGLAVHHSQERFVAPVVASMADALFPEVIDGAPVVPWMRAVRADGDLVGFVMLAAATDVHEPYLWRLLVDRRHQGRGVGRQIMDLVIDEVRAGGSTTLLTSWVEGRGSPRGFYESLGFETTGEIVDGETEARLTLG